MSEKQHSDEQRENAGPSVWKKKKTQKNEARSVSVRERNEEVEAGGGEWEDEKNIETQEVGEISQEDKQLFGSGSSWIRGCKSEARSAARHGASKEKEERNEGRGGEAG